MVFLTLTTPNVPPGAGNRRKIIKRMKIGVSGNNSSYTFACHPNHSPRLVLFPIFHHFPCTPAAQVIPMPSPYLTLMTGCSWVLGVAGEGENCVTNAVGRQALVTRGTMTRPDGAREAEWAAAAGLKLPPLPHRRHPGSFYMVLMLFPY